MLSDMLVWDQETSTLPANARLTLQQLNSYVAQPLETVTIYNVTNNTVSLLSLNVFPPRLFVFSASIEWSLARAPQVPVQNSTGGGMLFLVTLAAKSSNLHYLEGRVRSVVDGSDLLLSSGTEDYFLSAQYFDLGVFHTPLSGCTTFDRAITHSFSAYKFHVADPVVWQHSFALTWDIGDDLHPVEATTMTSYVWAYVW
eukprot:m.881566 g.881566  ORF g.881566 m.881566 type:complete len:199 (-) comp59862_c0_seq10:3620-4216(-)